MHGATDSVPFRGQAGKRGQAPWRADVFQRGLTPLAMEPVVPSGQTLAAQLVACLRVPLAPGGRRPALCRDHRNQGRLGRGQGQRGRRHSGRVQDRAERARPVAGPVGRAESPAEPDATQGAGRGPQRLEGPIPAGEAQGRQEAAPPGRPRAQRRAGHRLLRGTHLQRQHLGVGAAPRPAGRRACFPRARSISCSG